MPDQLSWLDDWSSPEQEKTTTLGQPSWLDSWAAPEEKPKSYLQSFADKWGEWSEPFDWMKNLKPKPTEIYPTAKVGNFLLESLVGSPTALATTGAGLLSGGAGYLGKGANIANKLLGTGAAIASVPTITEGVSEGNLGKILGGTAQAGMGILGAKSGGPGPMSKLDNILEPPSTFKLKNPTPRNIDLVESQGLNAGGFDVPGTSGVSEGMIVGPGEGFMPQPKDVILPSMTLKDRAKKPIDLVDNWIGDRQASNLEAKLIKDKFSALDEGGLDAIIAHQKNPVPELDNYFKDKYQQLRTTGKEFGQKDQYLPQLWNNSPDEIARALKGKKPAAGITPETGLSPGGKTLKKKAGFEFNAVVKDYEEGIKAGLTPKFDKISDLAGWYEETANKAIADSQLLKGLRENNLISTKPERGYLMLDPERFPGRKTSKGTFNYYAPAEVADKVNKFLAPAKSSKLQNIADATSTLKSIALTSGVPYTGINMHGTGIIARHALSSDSPISDLVTGARYLLQPDKASKYLDQNLEKAPFWTRNGLQLGTEHVTFGDKIKGENLLTKALAKQQEVFEKPLFQQIIPALKIQKVETIYDDLVKTMPPEEAAKEASKIVNTLFGSKNNEILGRSKDVQNAMRVAFLAPQWLESQKDIAVGMSKALMNPNDPRGKAYQNITRNLVAAYGAMNMTNKALSGHWMWENEAGKTLAIDTGRKDSKDKIQYLNVLGTGADFARLPLEAAASIAKGDIDGAMSLLRNRVSPAVTLGRAALFNQDWRGQKVYGTGELKKDLGNISRVGLGMLPNYMSAPVDYGMDKISGEEALASSVELPLQYRKPYKPKTKGIQPIMP